MIRVEHVTVASATADRALGAFIAAHPASTAYAMPGWLSLLERFMGAEAGYLVAMDDGRLAGVLPIARRPLHPRVAGLPARVRPVRCESLGHDCYAGPLIDPARGEARSLEVLDALVRSTKGPRALIRTLFLPAWADDGPLRQRLLAEHGFRALHAYPIGVKDLAGLTSATLPATYHQSHRRAVTAAKKRGVEVFEASGTADFLAFYDLYAETMEHAGGVAGYPKDLVVEGGPELVREGIGRLWMARLDGASVAGVFALEAGRTACYWLGATAKDDKALRQRPMHAVFHRAFAGAIERGCAAFELGGLVTEGLRTFKTRWGVREHEQVTFEWSYGDLLEPLRRAGARIRGIAGRAPDRDVGYPAAEAGEEG